MKSLTILLAILCLLFSCSSQEETNRKFLKEHSEFCFSLYDELYALDYDLSRSFEKELPPKLDKKIRTFLKRNRSEILTLRKSSLQGIMGTIPQSPSQEFEEFADGKELMQLIAMGATSDTLEKILDHPLIQLKLINPATFSGFVGNAIMARVITPREMGKRVMVSRFAGVQMISEKRPGGKWGLFYNNSVVQLYTEYDIQSGHSTIEKIYIRKEKSN